MKLAHAFKNGKLLKNVPLKWSNWYFIGLRLAVASLLALLVILFLLLHQNEADEQRSTLIADVLWLEQSVNFELEGTTEQVQQLANDLTKARDKHALLELRSQYLLKNSPSLKELVWLDASAEVIDSVPSGKLPRLGYNEPADDVLASRQARVIEMARKLRKPIYTDAYQTAEKFQFEVYSPMFESGQYQGSLVSVYSFDELLQQIVPWWFAEKYQVHILDGDGNQLASKSKIENLITTISYSIPLDPPGYGLVLQVTAYRSEGNLVQSLIKTLIIALAAIVLVSLWVMRNHIRRRLVAEQALRSEYAFRKAMEDSLTVGMRARNRQGLITYANPAFCQMIGFSAEELIGGKISSAYWAPDETERVLTFQEAVIEGTAPREGLEMRFMRKDGSLFDALIYEAPLIDADGVHTGWMASVVDISARKLVEELARQQQEKLQFTSRLVTMGELSSTLAHELNQPLAAIASYNTGCLNKLQSGNFISSEIEAALVKLGVQAQRAGRIIRRVHDFVRKSEPKRAPCDIAEVIIDSIALIESSAQLSDVRIVLVRELQGNSPLLLADRVMIEQVLLNLMRNGIEAMRDTATGNRYLTIVLKQLDEQIEIRVCDRGSGIPVAVQEKLFTPFFSTKSEGMGMGLNICRSIIEFHHGRLWVEDNPGGGTISAISLPVEQL